jgi:hypothetical protein
VSRNPSFKHDALAAVAAFASLTTAQLDNVARLSDERHLGACDELCCQDEFSQDIFLIAAGKVAVVVNGAAWPRLDRAIWSASPPCSAMWEAVASNNGVPAAAGWRAVLVA